MRLDTLASAETPEGIALTFRPAGLWLRAAAFALDLAIRVALFTAAGMVLSRSGQFGGGLMLLLWFALEWFYPVLFELLPGSATPGKRAFGLRVAMDNGTPVTPAASLLRNLLRSADFLPFAYTLGLLTVMLRSDFKRLGDLAAGTLVVHVAQPPVHRGLNGALPERAPQPPARALSPRAQAAVLAWAARAPRLTEERLAELALLARSATGLPAEAEPARQMHALLGVAQWVVGRRPEGPGSDPRPEGPGGHPPEVLRREAAVR